MEAYLRYFTPTPDQILGLVAVLVVSAGFVAIGGLAGGRRRLHETDVIVGWSAASLLFVLAGAFTTLPFRWVAALLAAAAVLAAICVLVRDRFNPPGDLLRSALLALPAIWLASCMVISQWDEFTQWIPNARYIFTFDTFPGEGKPPTFSVFPAYPHGLAYVIYLSSRIAGHLVENASGVFNILLLAMLGMMIGRIIRSAITRRDPDRKVPLGLSAIQPENLGWVYCALGGLAVTALNPTFVPKIVFTGYADTATAVLVGMMCILIWMLLNRLSGDDAEFSVSHIAWRLGFVVMALVAVKQVNLVLFLIALVAAGMCAVRDPAVRLAEFARALLPAVGMSVLMYALWRYHIQINGVAGEFVFAPASEWFVDDIGTIASRMALIASKKGGYFGLMLIATGLALRALWRTRTPLDRLSLIVGGLFVGYTAFLLFAYVTAFSRGEALRAASYWRYNMHLGGGAVAFAAFAAALLWRQWITTRLRRNIGWIAIVAMLAVPLAVAGKIRFDIRPAKTYVRATAEEIVKIVPAGARVSILDLGGNGSFGVIARYVISSHTTIAGELTAAGAPSRENIAKFLGSQKPAYVWVHYPTPAARDALGAALPDGSSHLLRLAEGRWQVVRSWAYPGYTNPYELPD